MRTILLSVLAATSAMAQPPDAEHKRDAAAVVTLNEAARARAAAADQRGSDADEAYRRELARYQADKAENDRAREKAAAAEARYRADAAAYAAAMARWQAQAAAAPAPPAKAEPKVEVAAVPADPTRRICRAEAVTGSRFPTRRCLTAAEWRANDVASRADVDALDAQRQSGRAGR